MKKIFITLFAAFVCVFFAGCENKSQPEEQPYADFEYYDNVSYVEFTNTSSNGLSVWSWEFGDGQSYVIDSNSDVIVFPNTIRHTYQEPGVYSVRMKVYNPMRSSINLSCTKSVRVRM